MYIHKHNYIGADTECTLTLQSQVRVASNNHNGLSSGLDGHLWAD